jgi:hypothetical protein
MRKNTINRPGQKPVQQSPLVNAVRKEKRVYTNNGALTKSTSLYKVLDMFFIAGASRNMSEQQIVDMFDAALAENTNLALKCIFWARDIREGGGERRFFRICMDHLRKNYKDIYLTVNKHVPFYGRWDDLFFSIETALLNYRLIERGLQNNDGLLAKWLPRKGNIAGLIRSKLRLSPRNYRKTIVALSSTVEQQMCAKQWKHISYPNIPSVAINKYRKAFYRNDEARFTKYIASVTKGSKKINASAIFPHILVRAIYQGENPKAVEAQWMNLPNYMEGSTDRIIPICDTSGSMNMHNNLPMDVSIALGVYISERNKGIFKNAFITFSAKPEMHVTNGTLSQRLNQIKNANAGYNTNLVASFNLILNSAIKHDISQKDMPTKILVISDMEFDGSGDKVYNVSAREQKISSKDFLTNYEVIERKYNKAGYKMPTIIFWNVNGRANNIPATKDDRVGLVSGFSPSILKSILGGKIYSPSQLMLKTIDSERYRRIEV